MKLVKVDTTIENKEYNINNIVEDSFNTNYIINNINNLGVELISFDFGTTPHICNVSFEYLQNNFKNIGVLDVNYRIVNELKQVNNSLITNKETK